MAPHTKRAGRRTLAFLLSVALGGCEAGDVDPAGGDAQAAPSGASDAAVFGDAGALPMDAGSLLLPDAASVPGDAALPEDAAAPVEAGPTGSGRMAGMLEAHNAVRAAVDVTPPLPALVWRDDIAAYAQAWADQLAASGCDIAHRAGSELQAKGYGENIAFLPTRFGPVASTAEAAVEAWASEEMCWTYGTLSGFGRTGTEQCDVACYQSLRSDGCGHYTAIVSKRSSALGCGVATCATGGFDYDIWVCNYNPAGNIAGQAPY